MAHTTNRIYIDTSVTPHIGVSIADIQSVIGSSRNDIGGLIVNGNINKWAKYKPTRKQGLNPTNWYEGDGKQIYGSSTSKPNYGFSFVDFSSLSALKAAMDAGNIGWEYEKPRGIATQPGEYFRFLDFNGYINNASSPFHRFGLEDEEFPTIDTYPAYLYVDFTRSDGSLAAGDFTLFDDWYFGVAVYGGGSGQLVGRGTATVAFGQQSDAARCVTMELPVRAAGQCYLYPFFSYNQIAWSNAATEPSGTQRYIPLPIGRETITVVSGGLLRGLTFAFGTTGGRVVFVSSSRRLTITFPAFLATNISNSQKTLSNPNIRYQVYIQKISDSSSHWQGEITTMSLSGSTVIAAGETATVFPSGTQKVSSNPSGTGTVAGESSTMTLGDFLTSAGGSFDSDYTTSILMWYWDADHGDNLSMEANPPFVYPA